MILAMYFVYVLKSINSDKFYIGHTNDINKRLVEHNTGLSDYTSKYMPWELIYHEAYQTRSLAMRREKSLKNHAKGFQELKKRILDEKGEG